MADSPLQIAMGVQERGVVREDGELRKLGIDPVGPNAAPYYAAWTRTDIALSAALLGMIANDSREILKYIKIIAGMLAVFAVAFLFGRFR